MTKIDVAAHKNFGCVALAAACVLLAACEPNVTPEPSPSTNPLEGISCTPNLDGVIDATELPTVIGLAVNYVASPPNVTRTVDLTGGAASSGTYSWDFGVSYADDDAITLQAATLGGLWFQSSFPTADFVSPIDDAGTTLGVYQSSNSALLLLGIASASPTPASQKTLLVYQPPVVALQYPLSPGTHWTSTGVVTSGTLNGLPYDGQDLYDVTDDAIGALTLHDFLFDQVHRVRTTVTSTPSAGKQIVTRQVDFLGECFGQVVHVVSQSNEPQADFTTAAALRRLAPSP
jgi:hypothetical protein